MRRRLAALTVVALAGLHLAPVNAQEPSAAGLWQQIDPETGKSEGWFLIYERNSTYEGAIVRMFLKPGDPPNPVCSKCTGELQGAPWLGLTIIKGLMRKGLDYESGSILDPIHGNEWGARMKLSPSGQDLRVTGYLGIPAFGKDQHWKRLPDCDYAQLDPAILAKFKGSLPKPDAGAKGQAAAC